MFQPNPEDRLHLRLHRARSVILTSQDSAAPRVSVVIHIGARLLGRASHALQASDYHC
ncbi:hypothetical protein F4781DRAFT_388498 [Annulohypoxylon bovei var. microspora]|nr:hypothetical protein F4781DRAFT_388498 [Annulohypoxylon bovei var. microspora]